MGSYINFNTFHLFRYMSCVHRRQYDDLHVGDLEYCRKELRNLEIPFSARGDLLDIPAQHNRQQTHTSFDRKKGENKNEQVTYQVNFHNNYMIT